MKPPSFGLSFSGLTERSRLLRLSDLLPGESLPSFLARLAKLNHYDPPGVLERVCLVDGGRKDQASRPLQIETLKRIAILTGIDPITLYAATAHRFAFILTSPADRFESLTLPGGERVPCLVIGKLSRQLRPESAAQFCPDCIRAAPYHRLAWLPVAVSACLQHKRVLVDQCPVCQSPLTIRAIVETRCSKCQANLMKARLIAIGKDALGLLAQQVIQAWLMDVPLPDNFSSYSIPDQSPAVLYSVVDGFRFNIINVRPGWGYMHKIIGGAPRLTFPHLAIRQTPTPDQSYRLFATAFKSLVNWSDGFREFLWAYFRQGSLQLDSGLPADPNIVYSQWLEKWAHPAFQFIREAFEEYLAEWCAGSARSVNPHWYRGNPVKSEQFAYLILLC